MIKKENLRLIITGLVFLIISYFLFLKNKLIGISFFIGAFIGLIYEYFKNKQIKRD